MQATFFHCFLTSWGVPFSELFAYVMLFQCSVRVPIGDKGTDDECLTIFVLSKNENFIQLTSRVILLQRLLKFLKQAIQ